MTSVTYRKGRLRRSVLLLVLVLVLVLVLLLLVEAEQLIHQGAYRRLVARSSREMMRLTLAL